MQVPTFTDPMNQVKPTDLPNERVSTSVPSDAFNTGPSAEKLSSAEMGAGKAVTDAYQEQQDRANQVAHIQMDTAASQLQTQIQVNVSKMKGQDAFGAPDYADQAWQDGISKIQDGAVGNAQKLAIAKTSAQRYEDLNKSVQLHVATESQSFADQTYQAGNDQARTAAVVNAGDDAQVQQNLDKQNQLFQGWAKLKGIPEDSDMYKDKLQAETSATKLEVIHQRLLSGIDDAAQKFFDDNKATMSGKDIQNATNALDASKVVGESSDIFNDVMAKPGFKDSQGVVDAEAVRKYVMDQTDGDMSDQRKLKVLGQVKAQVAEYNRDRLHQLSANERDFSNQVIQNRQGGMGLQDALKSATQWGTDAYDIAQKQAFIQKTYEPPAETKTIAHEQLREGITGGTVELSDLDRALDKGEINSGDWAQLRQLKMKTAADGTDPQMKYTDSLIKTLAAKNIGNDKQALADFQYVLNQKAQGKTADEKLAIAKDELSKVQDPKSWFWGTTQKFKEDAKASEGQNIAQGAMYQDIGFKQAQAISSGLTGGSFQRDANPAAHVQAFANTLGVKYEDMKIGTPVNNAIQSLTGKGKSVTPEAVQRVLQKFPDGNWK